MWLKWAKKHIFISTGPLGETWIQFKPHPLQHIYQQIGEGTRTAPGLTLLESEVKCLLFADDLVLLYPTKEGLQQHLDLLHIFSLPPFLSQRFGFSMLFFFSFAIHSFPPTLSYLKWLAEPLSIQFKCMGFIGKGNVCLHCQSSAKAM